MIVFQFKFSFNSTAVLLQLKHQKEHYSLNSVVNQFELYGAFVACQLLVPWCMAAMVAGSHSSAKNEGKMEHNKFMGQ